MKKIRLFCIMLLLLPGPTALALADGDFTFNPTLAFRGEYDDNINFDNYNEKNDWLGIFIPALKASWATPRFKINGSAEVEIRRFCSESLFDDEYQRYKIDGSYQLYERLTLEAGGYFIKDSTLDSELEETGIVENLYGRERYNLNAGTRYQLSERVFTALHYNYSDTTYDSPGNIDYDLHSIVGSISYLFRNQRDQVFLQPSYYRYNSEVSKVDNYGLSLGWNRTINERLTLSCYLGIRYTDSKYYYHFYIPVFDPTNGTFTWQKRKETINEDDFGGTADMSLSGRTEALNYKLSYNRDLTYTSTGSPIDRDRFTGSINWTISQRLRSGFDTGLYFSKANDDFSNEDSIYFYLHPHISYRLMQNHYLQLHYRYARTQDKTLQTNDTYDRNRVWLALVFNFPKLLD